MTTPKRELTLVRMFDAPRAVVFKAWTDPKLVAQWWGPNGVTNPVCELDVRPGGELYIVMLAGEALGPLKGSEWPTRGVFQEIIPPEKIVFTASAIVDGEPIMENTNTVTFEEHDGKTKMALHILVTHMTPEAAGPLAGMEMGWAQSLDKLVQFIDTTAA
jgi:uncharacterized protein YndB with AHSA1/START domain